MEEKLKKISSLITASPDFPKPGILFRYMHFLYCCVLVVSLKIKHLHLSTFIIYASHIDIK